MSLGDNIEKQCGKLSLVGLFVVTALISNWAQFLIVEHHTPLLRDALVEILSKEPEEKIKSLTGREEIRAKCAEKLKSLLKEETGQEIIREVLFTKYLYH